MLVRNFADDRKGSVAIVAAVTLATIAGLGAVMLNYAHGAMEKQRIQNALDSAAMAAAYNLPSGTTAATALGIAAYVKQVPAGQTLGSIDASAFTYGVWNDDTKTFTAGASATPLYYLAMNPVYYNSVRVTVGGQTASKPYVYVMFGGLLGRTAANAGTGGGSLGGTTQTDTSTTTTTTGTGGTGGGGAAAPTDRMYIGGQAIAYTPAISCLYASNIGDPYYQGAFPDGVYYKSRYPDLWGFALMGLANSSWHTCGYVGNTTTSTALMNSWFGSPSVGTYAVTTNGNFASSWVTLGQGIARVAWNPITVPDSAVAPYRTAACDFTNTVVDTDRDVTLRPGVYCGGLNIKRAGANVTMSAGVYVMRNGNFRMDESLTGPGCYPCNIDPASNMPVGPPESIIKTTVTGNGVTLLFQGSNTFFNVFGGALKLTAPTLAVSPDLGGMVLYSFDDAPAYPMNYFENARITLIGTTDMRNKKFFFLETNLYSDCDIVCMNIGNLFMQNTYASIYPGQFLADRTTMALSPRVRRPTYPMLRVSSVN